MKTIFITIFQGVEAKNILRTDIYKKLVEREDVRLVFFVKTKERAEYYQKEFNHPRVHYEVVFDAARKVFWEKIFSALKFILLRTATMDLRRRMQLQESGAYLGYLFSLLANRLLAHRWARNLARFFDYRLVSDNIFSAYFEKYNPSVVFLAHLFDDIEISLLREAKKRRVPTIGFINSWDKLTARCMIRLLPDKLVVFNGIVKKEAIKHADMPPQNIIVCGIPQYDQYINQNPPSREIFCRKFGLDPQKKIIVYAPMGKAFSDSDWDIIDLLNNSITSNLITNAELLVRLQPNDFVDETELTKRKWLVYQQPGVRFSKERGLDWDMSFADLKELTDTLFQADLFICYASSLSIDAACFDKPIINIDFEVRPKQLMSKSPTHFYKMTHYRNAARTGGIRFPKSKGELLQFVNEYLADPAKDREGRKRLVREQCWKLDGKAGERIAQVIIGAAL